MTALVLDADARSALAATRSLGAQGVTVHTADAGAESLAGHSRFSVGYHRIPSPLDAPDEYPAAVRALAREIGARVVFPMVDASVMLLCGETGGARAAPGSDGSPGPVIAAPGRETYETLSDKAKLLDLAEAQGIAVPKTLVATSAETLREAARQIGFPCVLKPARSRVLAGGQVIGTSVVIARDAAALETVAGSAWLGHADCLVQAFIPGSGAGLFSLYGHGGPVAWFAHRRLREKPPRGGVSVLSESVAVDPDLRALSEKLLSAADWFGPAMIEFRVDPQGRPWLMEVNGRFWGSLQLAIDSGVDFPWLLYRLCLGEAVAGPENYPAGRRLRWWLGDLDHLLLQLRGKGTASGISARSKAARTFLAPQGANTRLEVRRRDDPAPFRYELRRWFRNFT